MELYQLPQQTWVLKHRCRRLRSRGNCGVPAGRLDWGNPRKNGPESDESEGGERTTSWWIADVFLWFVGVFLATSSHFLAKYYWHILFTCLPAKMAVFHWVYSCFPVKILVNSKCFPVNSRCFPVFNRCFLAASRHLITWLLAGSWLSSRRFLVTITFFK